MRKKGWLIIFKVIIFVFLVFKLPAVAENDEASRLSLYGIKKVCVVVDTNVAMKKYGWTEEQCKADIEQKLSLAGIKVITSEECSWDDVNSAIIVCKVGVVFQSETVNLEDVRDAYNVWISLYQYVQLRRDPNLKMRACTWSLSQMGLMKLTERFKVRDGIKKIMDYFVNDYFSVNPKK